MFQSTAVFAKTWVWWGCPFSRAHKPGSSPCYLRMFFIIWFKATRKLTISLSLPLFDWVFELWSFDRSPKSHSKYKSTRERLGSKAEYER